MWFPHNAQPVRGGLPEEENMATVNEAASQFLAHKRIAVTGVSRNADAGHKILRFVLTPSGRVPKNV